jgi:hypothetical protein
MDQFDSDGEGNEPVVILYGCFAIAIAATCAAVAAWWLFVH